jgi:hypothetical protein
MTSFSTARANEKHCRRAYEERRGGGEEQQNITFPHPRLATTPTANAKKSRKPEKRNGYSTSFFFTARQNKNRQPNFVLEIH